MSEDYKEENQELKEELTQEVEEVKQEEEQHVEEESPKLDKGYISQEDWVKQGRDVKDWKSKDQFDRDGKLIGQIESLKKIVEQRNKEIETVLEYQKRTEERAYQKAYQDVELALKYARDNGDINAVETLTNEKNKLNQEQSITLQRQQVEMQKFYLHEFLEKNKTWYNEKNPELVDYAKAVERNIVERYPNKPVNEVLREVELTVRATRPDLFSTVRQPQAPTFSPSISSVNRTSNVENKTSKVFKGLSEEHKSMFGLIKRTVERPDKFGKSTTGKSYTETEFLQRLKADGEI